MFEFFLICIFYPSIYINVWDHLRMKKPGEIFKRIRKENVWTLKRVCDLAGDMFDGSYLNQVENGVNPNFYYAIKICQALGINPDDVIAEMDGGNTVVSEHIPVRMIPRLSWVQAGNWTSSPSGMVAGECDEWVYPPRDNIPNDCYALTVKGNSMQSDNGVCFPEGCTIIVNPNIQPENKSFVITMFNESGDTTFKQLIVDGPQRYLKPLNPNYSMLQINGEVSFCGVVIDVIQRII